MSKRETLRRECHLRKPLNRAHLPLDGFATAQHQQGLDDMACEPVLSEKDVSTEVETWHDGRPSVRHLPRESRMKPLKRDPGLTVPRSDQPGLVLQSRPSNRSVAPG